MTGSSILPPLPAATHAGDNDQNQVTLVRAHEAAPLQASEPSPAGIGHNLLSAAQRDLLRTGIARVRRIQVEINKLNKEKSAVYDTLRKTEVDPALARKVVYRLGLSDADLDALNERDAKLAAYWTAVADLRLDEEPEDEPSIHPTDA